MRPRHVVNHEHRSTGGRCDWGLREPPNGCELSFGQVRDHHLREPPNERKTPSSWRFPRLPPPLSMPPPGPCPRTRHHLPPSDIFGSDGNLQAAAGSSQVVVATRPQGEAGLALNAPFDLWTGTISNYPRRASRPNAAADRDIMGAAAEVLKSPKSARRCRSRSGEQKERFRPGSVWYVRCLMRASSRPMAARTVGLIDPSVRAGQARTMV